MRDTTDEEDIAPGRGEPVHPWPPRPIGWRVTYEDGSQLHELYDRPPMARWESVETDRLRFVDLIHAVKDELLVRLDCHDGTFQVAEEVLGFRLAGQALTGREGAYRDVVQYKTAYSEYAPGQGQTSGTTGFQIGYWRDLDELRFRALATLAPHTGSVGFSLDIEPHRAATYSEQDLEVLVDGEPATPDYRPTPVTVA